jgi:hypothetical protein
MPAGNRQRALDPHTPKPAPAKVMAVAAVDTKSVLSLVLLLKALTMGTNETLDMKRATALLSMVKAKERRS